MELVHSVFLAQTEGGMHVARTKMDDAVRYAYAKKYRRYKRFMKKKYYFYFSELVRERWGRPSYFDTYQFYIYQRNCGIEMICRDEDFNGTTDVAPVCFFI